MDPPATRHMAVEARSVTKTFVGDGDDVTALDDVSVSIGENEFFTLLGPSGCGKTTLLRLVAGFDHPTRGEIRLHGEDISHLPPYRRPVNTVFQSYALFPQEKTSIPACTGKGRPSRATRTGSREPRSSCRRT